MNGFEKLLIITSEFPPGPGGIGNQAFNISKYFSLNNFNVTVITVSDYTDDLTSGKFDKEQNFEIIRFKRYKSRLKTFSGRIDKIKSILAEREFDKIIFSGRFSIYASLFLKKFHKNKKFITVVHGTDVNAENPIENYFIGKALRRMDLLIPVSKYSGSKLPAELKNEKIKIIPNGFDLEGIDKFVIKEKSIPSGRLNLITVGSVSPRKGQHNILKAFQKILGYFPYAKYYMVGRNADDSKISGLMNSEFVKERVILTGQVSNEELYSILENSDIFILLSEVQKSGSIEGFGIAILEANYFGLPAIGSKSSGIADAIDDGKSGMLVEPGNEDEIAESVKIIVNNYAEFSKHAVEWAEKHHWSKIIKRYISAFKSLN